MIIMIQLRCSQRNYNNVISAVQRTVCSTIFHIFFSYTIEKEEKTGFVLMETSIHSVKHTRSSPREIKNNSLL